MGAGGTESFQEGETILLRRSVRESWLLALTKGPQAIPGAGVIDLTPVVGSRPGMTLEWAGQAYRVFRPQLSDLLGHLRRRAQIVTPKDAIYLLYLAAVSPGSVVAEAGSGSGALTTVLAHAVGREGRVVSCEKRPDFLEVARENIKAAGLAGRVEFELRDVERDGFGIDSVDAVVLDLPEPWVVFPKAQAILVPGGGIAAYVPTYNQLERAVRSAQSTGFEEVRAVELLERGLHVGEGGTRPSFEMLGHTGFLIGARWVG